MVISSRQHWATPAKLIEKKNYLRSEKSVCSAASKHLANFEIFLNYRILKMVRGGIRVRGNNIRGGIRGPFKKPFVPRHPFDLTLAEVVFPKVAIIPDDAALTNVSVSVDKIENFAKILMCIVGAVEAQH